jgi:hypothetical protein
MRALRVAIAFVCAVAGIARADEALSPITADAAAAAFERLKTMDGSWNGVSTKGWTDEVDFRTIAAESCLLETSFGAHPNETMLTLYHMHEGSLLLTHYCVAKNQPRLKATAASPDGRTIEFTFLDATGIPSRDSGHMDRLVITFEGIDRAHKRWFWYADGRETPMEGITLTRVQPLPKTNSPRGG